MQRGERGVGLRILSPLAQRSAFVHAPAEQMDRREVEQIVVNTWRIPPEAHEVAIDAHTAPASIAAKRG
jgi:hypothetical protein